MPTLVSKLREYKLKPHLLRAAEEFTGSSGRMERTHIQLAAFNREWREIRCCVPYYRALTEKQGLPDSFDSWEQIAHLFPPVTRDDIRRYGAQMARQDRSPEWFRITSGSSSTPLRMPAWRVERSITGPDFWLGRSWWGIEVSDPLFLLVGQAHLLGSGLTGAKNRFLRQAKDRLLGYESFPAYDLSQSAMRRAGEALINSKAKYVYGYSRALDLLARFNEDRRSEFRELKLKAVIGASEKFPNRDSEDLISAVLGAPVTMEYGSVETYLVAHRHPNGGYLVFWHHYFLEAIGPDQDGAYRLRITSLYPRCFPLIRYEIGDRVFLGDQHTSPLYRFAEVSGRLHETLMLPDGTVLHSETFDHCLREERAVIAYQAVQKGSEIKLCLLLEQDLSSEMDQRIRNKLKRIHPLLATLAIVRSETLHQTKAGKTPMIYKSS